MEVFVRNLPDSITDKQVRRYFKPLLAKLQIHTFHCQKHKGRGWATLTILDVKKGQQFLLLHGQTKPGREGFDKVQQKLFHMRKAVNCTESNKPPDRYLLQSMQREEDAKIHASKNHKLKPAEGRLRNAQRKFNIFGIYCGRWDYKGSHLVFFSHFQEQQGGHLVFGRRSLTVQLSKPYPNLPAHQIDIPYNSIQSMTIGNQGNATITLSLAEAPKMYEDNSWPDELKDISNGLTKLSLSNSRAATGRKRITAISKLHEVVVSNCLCYRFVLLNPSDILQIQALNRIPEIPSSISWDTSIVTELKFPVQMTRLNTALAGPKYSDFPFEVKFQLQRLAQNGYLSPPMVLKFMDVVGRFLPNVTNSMATAAIRRLDNQIPYSGPDTDASELSLEVLSEVFGENLKMVIREQAYSGGLVKSYDHIAPIHKAMVTPAGTYLSGPEPEVKNRVLRKYSDFSNYFLQVSFLDENGEQIWYERDTSNTEIYHVRFKKVLEGVINIAGRGYEVSCCYIRGLYSLHLVYSWRIELRLDISAVFFCIEVIHGLTRPDGFRIGHVHRFFRVPLFLLACFMLGD